MADPELLADRRIAQGAPPGEESPMLARDLFGPAAEQRVHDRIAEIERERRADALTSPTASVTWQATRPLTIREREVLQQVAAGRPDQRIVPDLHISRKTASNPITTILRKLGVSKRGASVAQALHVHDPLPNTPASSEG